jgi:hypothetical protein
MIDHHDLNVNDTQIDKTTTHSSDDKTSRIPISELLNVIHNSKIEKERDESLNILIKGSANDDEICKHETPWECDDVENNYIPTDIHGSEKMKSKLKIICTNYI